MWDFFFIFLGCWSKSLWSLSVFELWTVKWRGIQLGYQNFTFHSFFIERAPLKKHMKILNTNMIFVCSFFGEICFSCVEFTRSCLEHTFQFSLAFALSFSCLERFRLPIWHYYTSSEDWLEEQSAPHFVLIIWSF